MQLLLVRHALPLRSEHGEGSDPELAEAGHQQAARLPGALTRFPVARVVSSPQRRAMQTAGPVARALSLPVEVDERLAEYDRELAQYVPVEQIQAAQSEDWKRLAEGHLPASVDEAAFRARIGAAIADIVAAAGPDDTVAVFSHGGVINALLHEALGTTRLLSFPIDYVSITRLLCSHSGPVVVTGINGIEHVWDLLPQNPHW